MLVRSSSGALSAAVDAVGLVDSTVDRAQKEQVPQFSIDHQLKDVAIPSLVVGERSDTVVPPERQHATAGKLLRSKEVVYSGEGPMLAIERPDLATREIVALSSHS